MKLLRNTVSALVLGALAAAIAGCGPPSAGDDDDDVQIDAGLTKDSSVNGPDSTFVPPPVIIYAHSATDLYLVDRTSFAVTTVGPFMTDAANDITDIAVTPGGLLYGISRTNLYSIDRSTGRATLVAPLSGSTSNVGLTFLRDGSLLATDKSGGVRSINPSTGQVTEIGNFGNGLATAGDLVAVADGTMYAISDKGPCPTPGANCVGTDASASNWLLTVNTTTGIGTPIGMIGFGRVFGAAYANGKVYAFTEDGKIIEINRASGQGTMVKTFTGEFWGAGVTSLVPID
ncbi:MAG: hypothetical protein IT370_29205 [Deltaproteobacteria bacterium]|nr:hypothetical protein [Deltaproteobacteria bacterium]